MTSTPVTVEGTASTPVSASVRKLALALTETVAFQSFEQANEALQNDKAARAAIDALQSKENDLRVLVMLNAVPAEEQAELERLQQAVYGNPVVVAYMEAQQGLMTVCQATNDALSSRLGMRFALKRGGCCG